MKNIISMALIIIILTMNIIGVAADNSISGGLTDLMINGQPHWAKSYVDSLVAKGIIAGYPDGTFKPSNNVEVDAYIKMVVTSLGYNLQNGKQYWAMPYIDKAKALKLIDGTEFNSYRRAITREEAAKIIINALAIKEQLPSDELINKYIAKVPDYEKISGPYKKYVLYAYATGLITGDLTGCFNPKSNLSRAEASVVIMRLLDKSLRKPIAINEPAEPTKPIEFPELQKSDEEVWMLNNPSVAKEISSIGIDYDLLEGRIYFKFKSSFDSKLDFNNYRLKETINPDINRQVYELTKVLIDRSHYVTTSYVTPLEDQPGTAHVAVSETSAYAINNNDMFHFILFEDKAVAPKNSINYFSRKSTIALVLNNLRTQKYTNTWSIPFYEDKLRKSLVILFGQETGKKVYDYIYGVYMEDRRIQDPKEKYITKTIDNVQIDFFNDGAQLRFYFTINQ